VGGVIFTAWPGLAAVAVPAQERGGVPISPAGAPALPLPDLSSVPKDLNTPNAVLDPPAPGCRVRQVTRGYEATEPHHTLYLPPNWQTNRLYPLLVEYAGNGGFTNRYGDVCSGTVEGCRLGYGLCGGPIISGFACRSCRPLADARKTPRIGGATLPKPSRTARTLCVSCVNATAPIRTRSYSPASPGGRSPAIILGCTTMPSLRSGAPSFLIDTKLTYHE